MMTYTNHVDLQSVRAYGKGLFIIVGIFRDRYNCNTKHPGVCTFYAESLEKAIDLGARFNAFISAEYSEVASDPNRIPEFARPQGFNVFDSQGKGVLSVSGDHEWFSSQEIKELYRFTCRKYDPGIGLEG